jgi:hypothetical protein
MEGKANGRGNDASQKKRVDTILIDKTEAGSRFPGTIEYTWNEPSDPAGVFSFVYYFRKERLEVPLMAADHHYTQYLNGLDIYLQIAKSEAFRGWKVVIYIDQKTLDDIEGHMPSPAKERIEGIFLDPSVILAMVRWPRYSPLVAQTVAAENAAGGGGGAAGGAADATAEPTEEQLKGMVENAIMRCFRYHAFVYFRCSVFVRDADTYFRIEHLSSDTGIANKASMDTIIGEVGLWEHTLLQEHTKYNAIHGTPMLYGTQPDYNKRWHTNARLDKSGYPISIGTYAGMINYLGGLAEWDGEKGGLWQESVEYIKAVCSINPSTGISTNRGEYTYIGKDEQIPLFIWLPKLFNKTFFFYFPFVGDMGEIGFYESSRGPLFKKAYAALVKNYQKKGVNAFIQQRSQLNFQPYMSIKDRQFFLAPSSKLQDYYEKVILLSYNEETRKERHAAWYETWASKGLTDPEDPIAKYADMIPRVRYPDFLVNPYSVVDAFRSTRYDSLLRVLYRSFQKSYRLQCIEKRFPLNHVLEGEWVPENVVNAAELEEKLRKQKEMRNASFASFYARASPIAAPLTFPAAGGEAAAEFGPSAVLSFAAQKAKPVAADVLRGLGIGLSLGGKRKTKGQKSRTIPVKKKKKTMKQRK